MPLYFPEAYAHALSYYLRKIAVQSCSYRTDKLSAIKRPESPLLTVCQLSRASEKLGPSRNGRMEQNFPVIPLFRNIGTTSRGTPKFAK